MTVNELYEPIKEAVDNNYGNLEVYVQEFGKPRKSFPINFINFVSEWSSGNKKEYAEIIYENDCPEENDKPIQYSVGYTQQLADNLQSCRNEKQQIFEAWRKSNKESVHVIKELLHCMQNRMRINETERCMDMVNEVIHDAKNYVDKIESDINCEMIIPGIKENKNYGTV